MLDDPGLVAGYFVYSYEHIDDIGFWRAPEAVFPEFQCRDRLCAWAEAVSDLLRKAGWEGDGRLSIIWLPPFVGIGPEDTFGVYIWAVKQSNKGTTWLASPFELGFPRLLAQNFDRPVWRGAVPRSLSYDDTISFKNRVETEIATLRRELKAIQDVDGAGSIQKRILEHGQGSLVQYLQEYLDSCYLRVLHHVIVNGNSAGLKVSKSKAYITLGEDRQGYSGDGSAWLSLSIVTSDLLKAYCFSKFKDRLTQLFKSVELPVGDAIMFDLRKHVEIRNCIQHHQGELTQDSLNELGKNRLELNSGGEAIIVGAWQNIILSLEEVVAFSETLLDLADRVESQFERRIPDRTYRPQ